jgi:CheY-like chemotaxis protein
MTSIGDEAIEFADEGDESASSGASWKILIVDDDRSVHAVIKLALAGLKIDGRGLEFLDAYDGREACRIVRDDDGIALILLDLSMEGERSGLEAARLIRETIGDRRVRIVLCTGDLEPVLRAGTIEQLDLSECWQKSDLTARRLSAIVNAAIGGYGGREASRRSGKRPKTVTLACVPMSATV